MTRIISGRAGGLRLATPPGAGTRPTSDRVREALFSRLEHLEVLAGVRVLDLYAGSGALGLEALSRGATDVLLVEADQAAAKVTEANVRALDLPGAVVRRAPVAKVLATAPAAPYGLVFSDPPYALSEDDLAGDLALLAEHRWLTPDALVVVERSSRSPEPRWPAAWECEGERRYGETRIWFAGPQVPEETA
ncbi:16S rRNA (guanine(966)-N(2))-methyltransferase RsmD [Phycicoccus sp. Soil748]|uniref:16S rRNA (guanine(966)-N(2))-methyltransferase RsmD n=1 Tax=Intrasporangiaceae TaxID=85021 RepID=UPI000702694B|nr:16S rRNA (guanine(966)-N(2))-methyltransferase RsmD [Phycicoccus sp. Soil748]KRE55190.1 16S rRNA (guanine(966)-N(2))-methyltransferase RsmD [Phycicoccus sp. Soil748]